jgi:isocitrate/isopropylmalate dehydrogenase
MSDGLFLKCFQKVALEYPNIQADDRIVDNLCMQLVVNPNQFDILLLENLYGDIVSDLTAGLVGGLGVVAGANIGENGAVFEAVHGSAPDIAGQNKANPLALLQSAVLMMHHIGETGPAKRVDDAITKVLGMGPEHRTRDIGGTGSTTDFTVAICNVLKKGTRAED